MKKTFLTLSTLCLFLSAAAHALAQTPPGPPPILLIVREEIKPGEMPAHEQEGAAYVQTLAKANARQADKALRDGRLAMTPVAGNENEVTYIWPYMSFEDMENKQKALEKMSTDPAMLKADFERLPDNRLHSSQRDIIARFRPEYSYGIGRSIDIAQARYMTMTTISLKPGHGDEYWQSVVKHVNPARDKAKIKASYAVYQAVAGAPAGTFYVFRPFKSMAELDENAPAATRNAMSDDVKEEVDKVADRSMSMSMTLFYRFNPRLSHVQPEFAARDTAATPFWNPKPQPEAATDAGRRASTRPSRRP